MRCTECNVDLAETYTRCPLCGKKASDDKPLLENFTVAPYPVDSPVQPMKKEKKKGFGFSTERIKAFFNL